MPLFEGAIETFEGIRKDNVKVIVISNRDRHFVEEIMLHHDLDRYVDVVVAAGNAPLNKPNKAIADLALSKAQINHKSALVLFVGDALADMNCAQNSGALPVLMRMCSTDVTEEWIEEQHQKDKPLWVLKSHVELQDLLRIGPEPKKIIGAMHMDIHSP